ncbi:5-carboxymethyl-2-hydroxymuconate Delta-isomerase [Variovorax sp. ZT4R33]|uniref:5-carboxymethyl-2-hydroxymuconate Delta-isomerase n=1 Tax=Variovorax sp. ZT4R33 TaxID=3443743 RepID=UPI003F47B8D8
MPHLVILYTPNVAEGTDMNALCRTLCDTLLAQRDDADKQVFPIDGTRVLAYPAAHYAVADGSGDHGFVYLNLRMAAGRTSATHQRIGDAVLAAAQAHFAPVFARQHLGLTLQIDENPGMVYNGKHNNLTPLFAG